MGKLGVPIHPFTHFPTHPHRGPIIAVASVCDPWNRDDSGRFHARRLPLCATVIATLSSPNIRRKLNNANDIHY